MSLFAIGLIGLVICFLLIFLRMPIYIAFCLVGLVGIAVVRGWNPALVTLGTVPYTTASMYVWSVVPLFVFMGFLALHSGLAQEFFAGIRKWIGHFPGGLALSVIVGNAGFGACSGDPVSSAVTFSAMCLPEMRKYGYSDKLTLGAVGAGSILSGLIPPSLLFIVFGAITETSIGQLFIGGIFPGFILALLYIATISIMCWRDPAIGPPCPKSTWKERWMAGTGMWALIGVFAVIIGGIFIGLFTPTEAGAAGAFIVLVLALLRKRLSWDDFKNVLKETGITTGMVGMLLIGTMVLNVFLVITRIPATIASFIGGVTDSTSGTLWVIVAVLFVLGCFIDSLALTLIMVPILFPITSQMGVHPVHFGIVFTIASVAGALTPPFGIVVYAISGVAKDVPLFDIFKGVMPFLACIVGLLALVIYFPSLSLYLPQLMI